MTDYLHPSPQPAPSRLKCAECGRIGEESTFTTNFGNKRLCKSPHGCSKPEQPAPAPRYWIVAPEQTAGCAGTTVMVCPNCKVTLQSVLATPRAESPLGMQTLHVEYASEEVARNLAARAESPQKEKKMEYEVIKDRKFAADVYRVEATESDGAVYVAIFSGPDSERLAKEYASWKNQ